MQRRYLATLDQLNLWDKETARLKAIEFHEIRTDCDIVLLGTVDLTSTLRQMLDQIADRVTVYVVAPEDLRERFDEHGCLVPGEWCQASMPLRNEQLRQVDGPTEQAEAVSTWLAELNSRFSKSEVVVGVPDESLVPQLQRQLEQCGVRARWVEDIKLQETKPYRLLNAAIHFADGRRYEDLAALLRHADVEGWLHEARAKQKCGSTARQSPNHSSSLSPVFGGEGWGEGAESQRCSDQPPHPLPLSPEDRGEGRNFAQAAKKLNDSGTNALSLPAQLDAFYNTYLPSRVRNARAIHDDRKWPDLAPAVKHIDTWLEEASSDHLLRHWGDIFRKILGTVYGSGTLNLGAPDDEILHKTICRILAECDRLASTPEPLDTTPLSAREAFQVALGPLASETFPPPADADAVEILGWLELPLDDAPALIVTSFNEGFVPKSAGADAFLPDRLRRELGLLHNERRYARDAYATSVLCQSRQELRFLFAQRDTAKDPLQPSRLIFACPDAALIDRARQFFAGPKPEASCAPSAPCLRQFDSREVAFRGASPGREWQASRTFFGHGVQGLHRLPLPILPASCPQTTGNRRCRARTGRRCVRNTAAQSPGRVWPRPRRAAAK